jgi:hypothetical protein
MNQNPRHPVNSDSEFWRADASRLPQAAVDESPASRESLPMAGLGISGRWVLDCVLG